MDSGKLQSDVEGYGMCDRRVGREAEKEGKSLI